MSETLTRYRAKNRPFPSVMISDEHGEWVSYEDHAAALAAETARADRAEGERDEWRTALDELHVINWIGVIDGMAPRDAVRQLLERALDVERDELRARADREAAARQDAERISAGKLEQLLRKADEARSEWIRAENAEAERDRLRAELAALRG